MKTFFKTLTLVLLFCITTPVNAQTVYKSNQLISPLGYGIIMGSGVGTSTLFASTSPTVASINATSTTLQSTLPLLQNTSATSSNLYVSSLLRSLFSSSTYASTTALTVQGNTYLGSFSGVLKATSGLVSTAANGTDFTLISATTCGGTDKVSAVSAAGVITCTTDQTSAGAGSGTISTSTAITIGTLAYFNGSNTIASVATGTLSETIAGASFSATQGLIGGAAILSLDAGYFLASTSDFARINTAFASSTAINATSPLTYTGTTGNLSIQVGSGSQNGYISSTDWTTFMGKVASSSIDTLAEIETLTGVSNILIENDIDASSELAAIMDDETGTAGSLVFSAGPSFTGTPTFQNIFMTTTGTSTLGYASTTALTVSNNAWLNLASSTAITSTRAFLTNATSSTSFQTPLLGVGTDYISDITGTGLQNIAGALTLNATGDWTGTLDGFEGAVFNNKVSSTSIDTCGEFSALMTNVTGTCGNFVLSASPLFTGTISFTSATSSGSSTFASLTVTNGTTTNATSTSLFSTLGTFTNSVVNTLLTASGVVVTSFFDLVSGTGITIDAEGEMGLDTTDDQFLIADTGGIARVFATDEFVLLNVSISSTSPKFASGTSKLFLYHKDGIEITQIWCVVVGGTSKVVNVTDGTNDTETVTCTTTGANDTDVATNDTFTSGELGYVEFGATTGIVDEVKIQVWGRITRE